MEMKSEFSFKMAARLKQLREERGLSHDKLSERISATIGASVSRDSLIKYEVSDKHHTSAYKNVGMRVEYLYALAKFYNVSTDYILGLTDIKSPSADVRMACDITGLSEQSVTLLQEFTRTHASPLYYEAYEDRMFDAATMVDEFIDYALSPVKMGFNDYLISRMKYEENEDEVRAAYKLGVEEIARRIVATNRGYELGEELGMYFLHTGVASEFHLSQFCRKYQNYLEAKYPLSKYPAIDEVSGKPLIKNLVNELLNLCSKFDESCEEPPNGIH